MQFLMVLLTRMRMCSRLKKSASMGETDYNKVEAQNLIAPSVFKSLLIFFKNEAKKGGFDKATLQFKRVRPEGSKLPDSGDRAMDLLK